MLLFTCFSLPVYIQIYGAFETRSHTLYSNSCFFAIHGLIQTHLILHVASLPLPSYRHFSTPVFLFFILNRTYLTINHLLLLWLFSHQDLWSHPSLAYAGYASRR